MKSVFGAALAAVTLGGAGVAGAQTGGALIVEGAYERPASNLAFCGPCMTLWYVGAAPGARIDFTIEEPYPSAPPVVHSVTADPFGVGIYLFKPSGQGEVRMLGSSGQTRVRPRGCVPPIAPPRECPPPPMNPVRAVEREAFSIPLDDALPAPFRVVLQQFRESPDPRWEQVMGKAVLATRPTRQARIGRTGLRPGLYRLQFLGKKKEVIAVSLVRVDPRP